jgi:hypothetical protein
MPKVWNERDKNMPVGTVYVGRPTLFGNPFYIGRDGNREQVVEKFRQMIVSTPELKEMAQRQLKGRDLSCWCAPKACHADVLLEIANAT